jgi:hypothetical protein
MLPLLRLPQQVGKRLDKRLQTLQRPFQHRGIHLGFRQQRFLAKLKSSFHRYAPSFDSIRTEVSNTQSLKVSQCV